MINASAPAVCDHVPCQSVEMTPKHKPRRETKATRLRLMVMKLHACGRLKKERRKEKIHKQLQLHFFSFRDADKKSRFTLNSRADKAQVCRDKKAVIRVQPEAYMESLFGTSEIPTIWN